MKFMEITNLYDLGYEMDVNNNIFQDTGAILLEDDDIENTLKGFAYYLDSEFYFSNDKAKELFSSGFRKPFSEGFGLIMKNGKWGLIDRFGNTTFDYL